MPFKSKAQQRFMYSQKPKLAKEFEKKTKSFKGLPERADGSASDSALFKEDIPRKVVVSDVWMNEKKQAPKQGRQLEAAEEGGTLVGRLAARMASRDMIDEMDLGPKGKSPQAKKATIADNEIPRAMHIEGVAKKDLKVGEKIEREHDGTIKKLLAGKAKAEDAPKLIRNDHLKENKKYYDDKKGLPAMERKLDVADSIPGKMLTGMGLHQQTSDIKSNNSSDPAPDKGVRPGRNMAEQGRNARNVFDTMHRK